MELILRGLRRMVALMISARSVYSRGRALGKSFQFRFWKLRSRLLHGQTRWVTVYGSSRILVNSSDLRAFRIAELGGTQWEKIAVWREIARLKPELCLDVGANYGEFTAVAAEEGMNCIAVEVNPALIP